MVQSNPRSDQPLNDRFQQDLKNDLIAGLLVVIPLATTIWLATTVSRVVLAFLTSIPKQLNPFHTGARGYRAAVVYQKNLGRWGRQYSAAERQLNDDSGLDAERGTNHASWNIREV